MKKRDFMLLSAIIAIAVFSFVKANQEKQLSELALVNIEALAQNEGFVDDGTCYHQISTASGSQVRFCGTCTFLPNSAGVWGNTGKCW